MQHLQLLLQLVAKKAIKLVIYDVHQSAINSLLIQELPNNLNALNESDGQKHRQWPLICIKLDKLKP